MEDQYGSTLSTANVACVTWSLVCLFLVFFFL